MAGNSALAPVQARVFAILDADSTLDGLVGNGRIYDHVPAQSAFPYVCLVEFRERPDDTLGTKGRVILATIDAYSQAEGYKEVEAICEEVIRLLDNDDITGVTGWTVASSLYTDGDLTREIDGLTRHASMTFTIEVTAP